MAILTQVSNQRHGLLNGANSTHFQHFGDSRNYVSTFKKYFQKLIINSVLCFGGGVTTNKSHEVKALVLFTQHSLRFTLFLPLI